jgi:hypothetical protein
MRVIISSSNSFCTPPVTHLTNYTALPFELPPEHGISRGSYVLQPAAFTKCDTIFFRKFIGLGLMVR